MKGSHMRNLLMIIALVSLCVVLPEYARSESPEFALTFDCGKNNQFKLCLIQKFPPSKIIYLLSRKKSEVCTARTLKTFDVETPWDYIPATRIDSLKCKKPRQYELAHTGENASDYQLIKISMETGTALIDKADKLAKEDKLFKEILERIGLENLMKKPILYAIPAQKNTYIIQYLIKDYHKPGVKYGPLFFYKNGKVTGLDREAEIRQAFKLNGRYFILFEHGCWEGCGDISTTLLELKENGYEILIEDASWAT